MANVQLGMFDLKIYKPRRVLNTSCGLNGTVYSDQPRSSSHCTNVWRAEMRLCHDYTVRNEEFTALICAERLLKVKLMWVCSRLNESGQIGICFICSPRGVILCSFRFTVTRKHDAPIITSLSSRPSPDEYSMCTVCVADFLSSSHSFKLNANNMIWTPAGFYLGLGECGICVLLKICYNLMIEGWKEAVWAEGDQLQHIRT